MTAASRAWRTAAWAAAGGFAFGWSAKGLATPRPPIVEAPPPLVAVAPQNAPVKAPEGATVMEDGRVVTPLKASDPASLVTYAGDPCADKTKPRKK
ncbi:MAG: hypothetical protein KGJ84_11780 [Elusimicrobia bacterium]|nr:hypothetical protein [Elusimicrobiota bacterium]